MALGSYKAIHSFFEIASIFYGVTLASLEAVLPCRY
jgi:hypothetical protein